MAYSPNKTTFERTVPVQAIKILRTTVYKQRKRTASDHHSLLFENFQTKMELLLLIKLIAMMMTMMINLNLNLERIAWLTSSKRPIKCRSFKRRKSTRISQN